MKYALCALLVAACTSGDGNPSPDAAAPAAGAFGAPCTAASNTSTECTSMVCTDSFDMLGHPVCSQQCTMTSSTDPSCPNGSSGQKCNMKGYCKP